MRLGLEVLEGCWVHDCWGNVAWAISGEGAGWNQLLRISGELFRAKEAAKAALCSG